jgi:Family of unknown function (DUF5522)/Cysteine-rich CWC
LPPLGRKLFFRGCLHTCPCGRPLWPAVAQKLWRGALQRKTECQQSGRPCAFGRFTFGVAACHFHGRRFGWGGAAVTNICNVMSGDSMNNAVDPARCPLCGQSNDCRQCTSEVYKGPCWCMTMTIPDELLARVPAELKDKACICRACVMGWHEARKETQRVLPGDFYFDAGGLLVFTEAYHRRRGYCCGSGCRHCPYADSK